MARSCGQGAWDGSASGGCGRLCRAKAVLSLDEGPCVSLRFPKYMRFRQCFVRAVTGQKYIRLCFWILRSTLFDSALVRIFFLLSLMPFYINFLEFMLKW